MDPLSITASIITLYSAVVELNEITRLCRDADGTLAKIQRDCNEILEILRYFKQLLKQRRELLQPDDRFNSSRFESSLEKNCNDLIKEVNKLLNELAGFCSPPETRAELFWNYVRRYPILRRLHQAHAAINERLNKLRNQKSFLDRQHLPRASPSPTSEGSENASISAPPALDPRVRELRARLFLEAIRNNEYESVKRILEDTDVDPNNSFPLRGGSQPLLVATSAGNIRIVEILLRYGADISSQDSEGLTALHIASMNDRADMIDLLLGKQADPRTLDNNGHTPLWYAACGEYTENSFRSLLRNQGHGAIDESCDDRVPTPLWAAAAGGYLDRATALLEQSASISIRDRNGRTLLHRTEWPIAGPLTDLLLNRGADPWARDFHDKKLPLHRAAEQGRIDIVAKLLDKMVEQQPSSEDGVPNERDGHDTTPLMCAALNGSLPLVTYLVRVWDADFDSQDERGNNAFYYACAKGHIPVATFLLGLGADINRGNQENDTPLHIAATRGQEETVKFLLHLGANNEAMSRRRIHNTRTLQVTQGSQESQQLVTPAAAAEKAGHERIARLINDFQQYDRPVDWTVRISARSRRGG
ncbi:hypothetical protein MRS44_003955 [Fusarium solani]|uniref:uncharacterized protein n=1 Tax=Fusarium solani TaxID=169388 RepID=UPI0032C432F0|nr:hypothetical protein MRS44_003955 [Fusarium solani]